MSTLLPKADISLRTALRLPTDRERQKLITCGRVVSRREKDGMLFIRVPGTSYKDGWDKRLPQNNGGESILPT